MKHLEMFDPNTLMLHGLLDHPVIIQMEIKRLENIEKRRQIEDMVERLMGADENLDDLLEAVKIINQKEGEL